MTKSIFLLAALGAFALTSCEQKAATETEVQTADTLAAAPAAPAERPIVDLSAELTEHNDKPYIVNIDQLTVQNENYRTSIWTGKYHQLTVMSIPVGGQIGLEVHPNVDQFIRMEQGKGLCEMGDARDNLTLSQEVMDDDAIFVPAGTWHNVTNTGDVPIKLYTVYSPANHPAGTVQATYEEAWAEFFKEHPELAPKE